MDRLEESSSPEDRPESEEEEQVNYPVCPEWLSDEDEDQGEIKEVDSGEKENHRQSYPTLRDMEDEDIHEDCLMSIESEEEEDLAAPDLARLEPSFSDLYARGTMEVIPEVRNVLSSELGTPEPMMRDEAGDPWVPDTPKRKEAESPSQWVVGGEHLEARPSPSIDQEVPGSTTESPRYQMPNDMDTIMPEAHGVDTFPQEEGVNARKTSTRKRLNRNRNQDGPWKFQQEVLDAVEESMCFYRGLPIDVEWWLHQRGMITPGLDRASNCDKNRLTSMFFRSIFWELVRRKRRHREILLGTNMPLLGGRGDLLWKVDNFALRSEATAASNLREWKSVLSPTVAIARGYAIRLCLNPSGHEGSEGHMSLMLQVMTLDTITDETQRRRMQEWITNHPPVYPIRACFTLVLIDQSGKERHKGLTLSTLDYPNCASAKGVEKPKDASGNPMFGVRRMISLKDLWAIHGDEGSDYVRNDAVWVGLAIRHYEATFTGTSQCCSQGDECKDDE